jgi:hypothetical protein
MTFDFSKLDADLGAKGVDLSQAKSGGDFEREVPAAGTCRLRFVGYIETGEHMDEYQGKPKKVNTAYLTFEVSGPRHPPVKTQDGKELPHLITFDLNVSQSEKAHYYKLFNRMNHEGSAKHFVGLLGKAYKGEIIHKPGKRNGKDVIYVELYDKKAGSFTIAPALYDDPETGDIRPLPVAPAKTPIRCFVWALADKAMWDSIFIDGEWEARKDAQGNITMPAKSKNRYQNEIRAAINFAGSPAQLVSGAQPLNLDLTPETPARPAPEKAASAVPPKGRKPDALDGMDDGNAPF